MLLEEVTRHVGHKVSENVHVNSVLIVNDPCRIFGLQLRLTELTEWGLSCRLKIIRKSLTISTLLT
jgi:hypothetical protein